MMLLFDALRSELVRGFELAALFTRGILEMKVCFVSEKTAYCKGFGKIGGGICGGKRFVWGKFFIAFLLPLRIAPTELVVVIVLRTFYPSVLGMFSMFFYLASFLCPELFACWGAVFCYLVALKMDFI
jgi:hypothetical protein